MTIQKKLIKMIESGEAYCEKQDRKLTLERYYSCRCNEGRNGEEYCPYLMEIRKLRGRQK